MKKTGRSQIFWGLVLAFIATALFPLSIGWYSNHNALLTQLSSQVDEEMTARAEGLSAYLDIWTDMSLRMLKQNVSFEDVVSMSPARQKPILQTILKEHEWPQITQTVGLDGKEIARGDDKPLRDFSDRKWFQQALQGDYGMDVIIGRNSGKPSCTIAVPIFSHEQKRVGVLGVSTWVSILSDFIARKVGETGFTYAVNSSGRVLAHYKSNMTKGTADFSKHPVLVELGKDIQKKILFVDSTTKKKTVAFAKRGKYDWIVVVQQDYDEAYAVVRAANRSTLMLGGVILLVVIVISWLAASHLNRLIEEKKKRLFGIVARLGMVMVLLAAAPLGVAWLIDYRFFHDRFSDQVNQRLDMQSDALVARVNVLMDMNIKMLRQIAALDVMKSTNDKKQLPLLHSIIKQYPWYWVATKRLPDGNVLVRTDTESRNNVADRNYFQQAVKGVPFGSEIIIGKVSGKPSHALAVPIFDNNRQVTAVLSAISLLSDLSTVALDVKMGRGYAYLLTENGILAGHQKRAFTQAMLDFSKLPPFVELQGKNKNKTIFTDDRTAKEMISYAQRTERGWIVVVQQEVEQSFVHLNLINQKVLHALLGAIVFAVLFALIIARYLQHYSQNQDNSKIS